MGMSDADADALYRRFAPTVFRVCKRYVGDEADAEDLTHGAFERILRGHSAFRGDSELFTWIYRVAVNEALQFLRREKRRKAWTRDGGEGAFVTMDEDGPDVRISLAQVLERFDPETQEIAVLHYREGLSQEETAAAMGISLRTLEYRLRDFRVRARKWMEGG
jgi:RNA polymerase sigma-70 factor, ECF subfamily